MRSGRSGLLGAPPRCDERRVLSTLAIAGFLSASVSIASAATSRWINPAGGDIFYGPNWSPSGTPYGSDMLFDLHSAATYSVGGYGVASFNDLEVRTDKVDFSTYGMNGANPYLFLKGIRVGDAAGAAGELLFSSYAQINGDIAVGRASGAGRLTLSGTVLQEGNVQIGAGAGSDGMLGVAGFFSTSGDVALGGGGGTASLTLVADGARLITPGTLTLGAGSTVTLDHPSAAIDFGTVVAGGGVLDLRRGVVTAQGPLRVGVAGQIIPGPFTLSADRALGTYDDFTIDTSTLTVDGGALYARSLVLASGGAVDFRSGTIGLGSLVVGPAGPLGKSVALSAGRTLEVSGVTTLSSSAALIVTDGGVFRTGKLGVQGASPFALAGGTFEITDDTLVIDTFGPGRPFGANVTLKNNTILRGSNVVIGDTGIGTVDVRDGAFLGTLYGNVGYMSIAARPGSVGTLRATGLLACALTVVGGTVVPNPDTTQPDLIVRGGDGRLEFAGALSCPVVNFGTLSVAGDAVGEIVEDANGFFNFFIDLRDTSRLVMQIGGRATGQFDRIDSDSMLALDGVLDVRFADGFVSSLGDRFTIIASSAYFGISGQFDTTTVQVGGRELLVVYEGEPDFPVTAVTLVDIGGAVPEPAAVALLLTAGLLAARPHTGTRSRG